MTYQRLPYEDAAPTPEMVSDCVAVGRALRLRTGAAGRDAGGRPGRRRPRRHATGRIVVPDSLAERAREMQLHLG
jgi:hypothetical protein